MEINKVYVFNNNIESGLRILHLLNSFFPKSIDREKLIYLDYILVHSGDFGSLRSLHAPVPGRKGEIYIRRNMINEGLELLESKGLIEKKYLKNKGIEFKATESSTPFIDSLSCEYLLELNNRSIWVGHEFGDLKLPSIKKIFINKNLGEIDS